MSAETGIDGQDETSVTSSPFAFSFGGDGTIGGTGDFGEDGGDGGNGGDVDLTVTGVNLSSDVDGTFLPIYVFAMGGYGADGGASYGGAGGNGGDGGDVLLSVINNTLTGGADADFFYVDLTTMGGNAGYGGTGDFWGLNGTAGSAVITFSGNHITGDAGTDMLVILGTAVSTGPTASVTLSNNIFDAGADNDVLHVQTNVYNPTGNVIYDMHDNQFLGGDGADDMLDFGGNGIGVDVNLDAGTVLYAESTESIISYDNLVSGFEHVNGSGYNDRLTGDGNSNTLIGDYGDDLLTGGAGNDTFYFADNFGNDTVTDFEVGSDVIDLRGCTSVDTAALINSISDAGGNAVVQLTPYDSITLEGVNSQVLIDHLQNGGGDFLFS